MNRFSDFDKYIADKDIFMLREALGNTIYGCRDFSDGEFDDAVKYVESKGIKIKDDELQGELVTAEKQTYTDDDFAVAIARLKRNFCDERIADVKKIGKALYPSKPAPQKEPTKQAQSSSAHTSQIPKSAETTRPKTVRHQHRKWILAAALLVAVIAVATIVIIALQTPQSLE